MRCLVPLMTVCLLVAVVSARAQQVGQNTPAGGDKTYTLSVKAQLVVETVVAKDKQGNAITNLTAKDFTVTEDGSAQQIRFFQHEHLPVVQAASAVTNAGGEDIKIYKQLSRTQIGAETAEKPKYKDKRLLTMYFDMSAMGPTDQLRALTAAEKFIRTQMTEADLVSIMRYSGGSVDVLQDFSADHDKLLSVLQTLIVGEGQGSDETVSDAASADVGAAFGQDDSEFNIFNTDRQLSALQTAAHMLGLLNEKKALIYFASGLRLNGIDNQAQLRATVDAAIRAGVSFWPVDARGLVAGAPLGDATHGSPGNEGMYSGAAAQAGRDSFQQSQDTLYSLAADTGGKALFDNNDLTRGIQQAQAAITDYYILGYYTTNTAQNGAFRKVKITVTAPELAQAKLDYRQGYYADKVFAKFTAVDKERQLEDALMLGDPLTELTIAMEIDYFQLNRAEYYVPVILKIPGRELVLAKRGGAEHTLIDFVGEIKDLEGGTTVANVRDNVNIKLNDQTAADLAHKPIEYDTGFTLLPGRYQIKVLARDDETGRIGTYIADFTIPNLAKETRRVAISSVVLSSQRVDLKDALYDAMKGKDAAKEAAVDPLVRNGAKLMPSVTRVFSGDRPIFVYLQAYGLDGAGTPAPAAQPLAAFVTFYLDGKRVFETKPKMMTPAGADRLGTAPLDFTIPPNQLAKGEYDCQVTVLDPTRQHVSFWRAPVTVVR